MAKFKKLILSFGFVFAFAAGAGAATVNVTAEIVPSVGSDSFDSLDSTYTISAGDTVTFDYRIAAGSAARFDVNSASGDFAPWVRKSSLGFFTISSVTLELQGFSTNSAWDGKATLASQSDGFGHLGPLFQYSDFGLSAGDSFSFTNILVSFNVNSVTPTRFTTSQARTRFNGASISFEPVPAVPLPAAGWLLIAGLGGLAALRRRSRG